MCGEYVLCVLFLLLVFFFFEKKTAYEMRISGGSSDVCSSDLPNVKKVPVAPASAKMCSTASQFASTRHSSVGQSARSIVRSKAPTWNQSSTSTDRPFCIFPHLHQRDSRFRPDCQAAQVRDDRSEAHPSELQSLMRISYAV